MDLTPEQQLFQDAAADVLESLHAAILVRTLINSQGALPAISNLNSLCGLIEKLRQHCGNSLRKHDSLEPARVATISETSAHDDAVEFSCEILQRVIYAIGLPPETSVTLLMFNDTPLDISSEMLLSNWKTVQWIMKHDMPHVDTSKLSSRLKTEFAKAIKSTDATPVVVRYSKPRSPTKWRQILEKLLGVPIPARTWSDLIKSGRLRKHPSDGTKTVRLAMDCLPESYSDRM